MYKIEKVVNFNEWDGLVSNSIYNNIFFKTFFFKYLKKNIDLKFIKRGNIIKAGFFLIKNNKKTILDDEIIIHSGLILFKNEKKKQSSLNIENYDIISFFVDYASRRQNNVPVKVTVNKEPNEEIKDKVSLFVSQKMGHNTPIKYEINKTMLGGVVLKYKDNEIDLSVDNKLDGLNSVLTN